MKVFIDTAVLRFGPIVLFPQELSKHVACGVGPGIDKGQAARKWTPPIFSWNPKTLLLSWALILAPSLQNELLPGIHRSSSRVEFCLLLHQVAVGPDSLPSSTVPRRLLSPEAIDIHSLGYSHQPRSREL